MGETKADGDTVESKRDCEDHEFYYRYSMKSDPKWSDISPLKQDDGPFPIAKINYSEEFVETFDYLRAVLQKDERSNRAFKLTEKAARLNPANYTVWFFRRRLIRDLSQDLDEELMFLDEIIEANPKNYQVWFHRQKVVDMKQDATGELKFVKSMLEEDAKNYHAWQYRQWLLKTFSLWDNELTYVNELINEDVRNNSAWNQRYFVISHTTDYGDEVLDAEILFTLSKIDVDVYNESAWNYLRGITQNMKSVFDYLLGEPYTKTILDHIRVLLGMEKAQLSPYLCMFAIDCFEELLTSKDTMGVQERQNVLQLEVFPLIHKLETCDDIVRKNYWKFIRLRLSKQFNCVC